ncbi:MAG: DUF1320 domain-containing protein [bacterium]
MPTIPYCTKADIYPDQISISMVIKLTDDSGLKTEMDETLEAVVDKAIIDASAEIDGYCQKLYAVPLTPVPELIRKYAVDMAIYNLYARRDIEIPEIRKDRHHQAIAYLKLVTEGKAALGAATPVADSPPNEVSISSNSAVFTRANMEGF